MKVRLTRVDSSHSRLRTGSVDGVAQRLPEVGKSFFMVAPPLEAGDIRVIETSAVKEIVPGGFRTENSEYQLEVFDVA